jgi:hypothetical protein
MVVKCRKRSASGNGLRCALPKGHATHPTKGGHWGPVQKIDLGYTVLKVRAGFCHTATEHCHHVL